MSQDDDFELVHGSGNVFADFGRPNADLLQLKAILGARIIGILEDRQLTVRKAEELTGIAAADFSRIRQAKLSRFSIERLIAILNRFDQQVEIDVRFPSRAKVA